MSDTAEATTDTITPEKLLGQASDQARELGDRFTTAAKKAGNVTLDVYESTLKTLADYTESIGAASPIESVATITKAQAHLTRELTGAYTAAARTLIAS